MATKGPKVTLKRIGKELDVAISKLEKLHNSGKLTTKQMTSLKLIKLPSLRGMRMLCEKLCHDPYDPWLCPPSDLKGEPFGPVPVAMRVKKGGRKK